MTEAQKKAYPFSIENYNATYGQPVKPVSFDETIDHMEICFWLFFSSAAGVIVSAIVYNLLVSGRIF